MICCSWRDGDSKCPPRRSLARGPHRACEGTGSSVREDDDDYHRKHCHRQCSCRWGCRHYSHCCPSTMRSDLQRDYSRETPMGSLWDYSLGFSWAPLSGFSWAPLLGCLRAHLRGLEMVKEKVASTTCNERCMTVTYYCTRKRIRFNLTWKPYNASRSVFVDNSHCVGCPVGSAEGAKLRLGDADGIIVGSALGLTLGLALGATEYVPHSIWQEQGQLSTRSKISSSV